MKKIVSALLCLLIITGSFTMSLAKEKSIQTLSGDSQVENASKSYEIIYKEKKARVFYGTNGIDIVCEDETVHLTTNFAVTKLLPVGDLNNDGIIDFAITENSPNSADNLFVVSGADGSIMNSTSITRMIVIDNEYVKANTSALVMKQVGTNLFVVYDYTIMKYDLLTGTKVFEYVNEDNVWDIEPVEDRIVFVDQLGRIGFVNAETGEIISKNKIANSYNLKRQYDSTEFVREMNLWDVFYENGQIYVTTEDGYLLTVDSEGNVTNNIEIGLIPNEDYQSSISEETERINGKIVGRKTGIMDPAFKSYKIIESTEQYLVIGCYFVDDEALSEYFNFQSYQSVALYDKALGSVTNIVKINNDSSSAVSACLTTFNDALAIATVAIVDKDSIRMEVRDLQGSLLYQKSYSLASSSEKPAITINKLEEGYLVEAYNGSCAEINKNNEIKYSFENVTVELMDVSNDSITMLYTINGKPRKVVNYQLDCKTVNWEYVLAEGNNHKGIEFMLVDDYNKDGVKDFLCLVQNYDKEGANTDTIFLFINGKDGTRFVNGKIFSYTGYTEYGYAYPVYLQASKFSLADDINGDGYREIVVGGQVISSSSYSIKGSVDTYINAKGLSLPIGDINGDGIEDIMMLTDESAILYRSRRNGYNYDYVKTDAVVWFNKNNKSSEGYTFIGDVNNDGISEVAFPEMNKEGHRTYGIYDGKSLKRMFTFASEGVSWTEMIKVTDIDINNDGYNEILRYSDTFYCNCLIDGKTGQAIRYINNNEKNDRSQDEVEALIREMWHPEGDAKLEVATMGDVNIVAFGDVNNDGVNDFALIKNYTDYETWQNYQSIFIYSGDTFDVIEERVVMARNGYSSSDDLYRSITKVNNSNDLIALNGYGNVTIYSLSKGERIATYSLNVNSLTAINDKTILAMDENKKIYLINTEKAFVLETDIPETVSDHKMQLKWTNNEDYSVMTISDNGSVIYKGTDQNYEARFTEGKHTVTFVLDDGQGKKSVQDVVFTVEPQANTKKYLAGVGAAVAIVALVLNMYRKIYVSKKVKGGLK